MSIFGPSSFRHLLDYRINPPMWTVRPVERDTADCVCEEPCRYCKCETSC